MALEPEIFEGLTEMNLYNGLKPKIFLLCLSLLSLFSQRSLATDGLFTGIHHHYQSSRALGMGDAYVAVANDYNTLFYNPAGLGRLQEGQLNLSMDFEVSNSYLTFSNDVASAMTIQGTDAEKQTKIISVLQKNYGNPVTPFG